MSEDQPRHRGYGRTRVEGCQIGWVTVAMRQVEPADRSRQPCEVLDLRFARPLARRQRVQPEGVRDNGTE